MAYPSRPVLVVSTPAAEYYSKMILKLKAQCWDLRCELHKHDACSLEYADALVKLNNEIKYLKSMEDESKS